MLNRFNMKFHRNIIYIVLILIYCIKINSGDNSFIPREAEIQAVDLFKKFDMTNISFAIEKENIYDTAKARVSIDKNGINYSILVSRKLWKMLDEKEREFVLCHEISHIKRKHYIISLLQFIMTNSMIVLTPLITMNHLDKHNYKFLSNLPSKILISILGTGFVKFFALALGAKIDREAEYQADRDALLMTKNLKAGIEALKKEKINFAR